MESVVHQARMEVTDVGVTAVNLAVATASTDHATSVCYNRKTTVAIRCQW